MYPLAMALLFSGLCALANLAYPGPDIQNDRALSRGHELALVFARQQATRFTFATRQGMPGHFRATTLYASFPRATGQGLQKAILSLRNRAPMS